MERTNRDNHKGNLSAAEVRYNEQPVSEALEPYVTADDVAAFIGESRRNVLRMAREGTLTCYLMSGSLRHTYKFKLTEVSRDLEKRRRQSGTAPEDRSSTRSHNK